jgi:AraC family transcriptional regulator, positive regulator of tynA and feaB
MIEQDLNPASQFNHPLKLSTDNVPAWYRHEWLREVIGREYANVDIVPPKRGRLFNEMTIYPWQNLRLSVIRSNSININRLPNEPHCISQDTYFGVILLSGEYMLEQNNREVFLKPGDMTIYDATRPHRIHCPNSFSKLLISIPRKLMQERLAGVEHCTALHIKCGQGIAAVASSFIQTVAQEAHSMTTTIFDATAESSLDLFTMALSSVRPQNLHLSRSRSLSLYQVKYFVERNLRDPTLDTTKIVAGTRLSARYINELFKDENTSLMRYVWDRRLVHCYQELTNPMCFFKRLSEVALSWGFNDLSHFSRAFKQKYGISPRGIKELSR